ncbi:IS1-like element transposase [Pleurocapsa sp. FMAR1]|uniref:IS1-like element transposase n=1 Tax=Pleurocapsa sp. FMAR1 TaxID=3040204 RepID=UPI0029C7B637|nr:IS1-like element transposase [Pleurocapsa sp. FMAR1]
MVRNGKTGQAKQLYLRQNQECLRGTFIADYTNHGYKPEVKQKIIEMAVNGSEIRNTARVLSISTHTLMKELKKAVRPR